MATAKPASDRKVQRRNSVSVPKGGSKSNSGAGVARSDTGRRTPAQKRGTPKPVLPAVQPPLTPKREAPAPRLPTASPSDRYPHVAPEVLLAAFERAETNGAPDNVEWDASKQQWVVPSATPSRGNYRLWRRRGRRGPLPFYVALECNCRAEQSGSYLACWHKCAVKLWLNEWFSKRSFAEQLEDAGAEEYEDEPIDPLGDD